MERRPFLRALSAAAVAATGGGLTVALRAAPGDQMRTISWDDLMPPDWDPFKQMREATNGVSMFSDADPRARDAMKAMREIWDTAPTVGAMDGNLVKLPGYIVPLEEVKGELKEFLLVPYFGACIHTPPPPANQIIHVVMTQPAKGYRSMDAVWISGKLTIAHREDAAMGASGYRLQAGAIERYVAKPRP